MKNFAGLCEELDGTTKITEKVSALRRYFEKAIPADAAWAVAPNNRTATSGSQRRQEEGSLVVMDGRRGWG